MSTVELFWRTRHAEVLGLTGVDAVGLDWAAMVSRKNQIVESWSKGTRPGLEKRGVAVIQGQARFTGPNEIAVGERTLRAERFVIATGSAPSRPPIPGVERAVTSDELLDLKTRPSRMVVIGGGYVGMEFGYCLARAGTKVTILQKGRQVLPAADDELREALVASGREAGIEFHTNADVTAIGAGPEVEAQTDGTTRRFPAEIVLVATSRPPRLSHLNPEVAGVELERGGIKVNDFLQSTSAPRVYAAGDVIGRHQHTPVAWYEGQLAGHNAMRGNEKKADLGLLPTTVFTIPALAQVGLTEAEALREGFRVRVNRSLLKHNPAAGVRNDTEGLVKVVYEEQTERILGVHVLGAHAEDLIQIAAVAMRGALRRGDVGAMHYVFPTLGGAVFDAMAGW